MSEQEQPQTEQINLPTTTPASLENVEIISYLTLKYIHLELGKTVLERHSLGIIRVDRDGDIIVTFDQLKIDDSTDLWALKPEQITYGEMTFLDDNDYMGTGQELVDQLSEE